MKQPKNKYIPAKADVIKQDPRDVISCSGFNGEEDFFETEGEA